MSVANHSDVAKANPVVETPAEWVGCTITFGLEGKDDQEYTWIEVYQSLQSRDTPPAWISSIRQKKDANVGDMTTALTNVVNSMFETAKTAKRRGTAMTFADLYNMEFHVFSHKAYVQYFGGEGGLKWYKVRSKGSYEKISVVFNTATVVDDAVRASGEAGTIALEFHLKKKPTYRYTASELWNVFSTEYPNATGMPITIETVNLLFEEMQLLQNTKSVTFDDLYCSRSDCQAHFGWFLTKKLKYYATYQKKNRERVNVEVIVNTEIVDDSAPEVQDDIPQVVEEGEVVERQVDEEDQEHQHVLVDNHEDPQPVIVDQVDNEEPQLLVVDQAEIEEPQVVAEENAVNVAELVAQARGLWNLGRYQEAYGLIKNIANAPVDGDPSMIAARLPDMFLLKAYIRCLAIVDINYDAAKNLLRMTDTLPVTTTNPEEWNHFRLTEYGHLATASTLFDSLQNAGITIDPNPQGPLVVASSSVAVKKNNLELLLSTLKQPLSPGEAPLLDQGTLRKYSCLVAFHGLVQNPDDPGYAATMNLCSEILEDYGYGDNHGHGRKPFPSHRLNPATPGDRVIAELLIFRGSLYHRQNELWKAALDYGSVLHLASPLGDDDPFGLATYRRRIRVLLEHVLGQCPDYVVMGLEAEPILCKEPDSAQAQDEDQAYEKAIRKRHLYCHPDRNGPLAWCDFFCHRLSSLGNGRVAFRDRQRAAIRQRREQKRERRRRLERQAQMRQRQEEMQRERMDALRRQQEENDRIQEETDRFLAQCREEANQYIRTMQQDHDRMMRNLFPGYRRDGEDDEDDDDL